MTSCARAWSEPVARCKLVPCAARNEAHRNSNVLLGAGLKNGRVANPARVLTIDVERIESFFRSPGEAGGSLRSSKGTGVPAALAEAESGIKVVGVEDRLNALVATSQRQSASAQDQQRILEHKLGDQHKGLQGVVEDLRLLTLRVEAVDESIWSRISTSERAAQRSQEVETELLRLQGQTRLLEQQLAESSKRSTRQLKRAESTIDDLARNRFVQQGDGDNNFEQRLRDLEDQYINFEDEIRALVEFESSPSASVGVAPALEGESLAPSEGGMRELERRLMNELDTVIREMSKLKVKAEGHDNSVASIRDRMDTAAEQYVTSLRMEHRQTRDQDRNEMIDRISALSDYLRKVVMQSEDALAEVRSISDGLIELRPSSGQQSAYASPRIQVLEDGLVAQGQQLRFLQEHLDQLSAPQSLQRSKFGSVGSSPRSLQQREHDRCAGDLAEQMSYLTRQHNIMDAHFQDLQQQIKNVLRICDDDKLLTRQLRPQDSRAESIVQSASPFDRGRVDVDPQMTQFGARLSELERRLDCCVDHAAALGQGDNDDKSVVPAEPVPPQEKRVGALSGHPEMRVLSRHLMRLAAHLERTDDMEPRLETLERLVSGKGEDGLRQEISFGSMPLKDGCEELQECIETSCKDVVALQQRLGELHVSCTSTCETLRYRIEKLEALCERPFVEPGALLDVASKAHRLDVQELLTKHVALQAAHKALAKRQSTFSDAAAARSGKVEDELNELRELLASMRSTALGDRLAERTHQGSFKSQVISASAEKQVVSEFDGYLSSQVDALKLEFDGLRSRLTASGVAIDQFSVEQPKRLETALSASAGDEGTAGEATPQLRLFEKRLNQFENMLETVKESLVAKHTVHENLQASMTYLKAQMRTIDDIGSASLDQRVDAILSQRLHNAESSQHRAQLESLGERPNKIARDIEGMQAVGCSVCSVSHERICIRLTSLEDGLSSSGLFALECRVKTIESHLDDTRCRLQKIELAETEPQIMVCQGLDKLASDIEDPGVEAGACNGGRAEVAAVAIAESEAQAKSAKELFEFHGQDSDVQPFSDVSMDKVYNGPAVDHFSVVAESSNPAEKRSSHSIVGIGVNAQVGANHQVLRNTRNDGEVFEDLSCDGQSVAMICVNTPSVEKMVKPVSDTFCSDFSHADIAKHDVELNGKFHCRERIAESGIHGTVDVQMYPRLETSIGEVASATSERVMQDLSTGSVSNMLPVDSFGDGASASGRGSEIEAFAHEDNDSLGDEDNHSCFDDSGEIDLP